MAIRVYNTLTRRKEDFQTVQPGKVGMYVCGPTVYAYSHIGHMVGPVIFDTVKRHLQYSGYDVKFVVNVTDVDDKIIVQANKEGCSIQDLTERVTNDYFENLKKLDVHVDAFPRATEHIPNILSFIAGLVEKGFAYAAGGDVYFEVSKDEDYGKLSNRKLEEMFAGVRKEVSDLKRHPGDFALWKGAKPGEPAWDSPWGPGRPGWHIECSAMSMALLGETFDIHGGGLDLCFPHHEDEIAQSECYTGKPYVRYWMHNGLMQKSDATRKLGAREGDFASQESDKMSKSKGNVIVVRELFKRFSPELIRFFLLSTHYRRPIDYGEDRLDEVNKGLARLQSFCERASRALGKSFYDVPTPTRRSQSKLDASKGPLQAKVAELRDKFIEAMDDDFNSGAAVGALFELLPVLNRWMDEKGLEGPNAAPADREAFLDGVMVFRELTWLLGVLQRPAETSAPAGNDALTPKLLDFLLEVRLEVRKAKNYALSDRIRDRLKELGVTVEDRPDGSRWKLG